VPDRVLLVDSLPRTANDKLDRRALAERATVTDRSEA